MTGFYIINRVELVRSQKSKVNLFFPKKYRIKVPKLTLIEFSFDCNVIKTFSRGFLRIIKFVMSIYGREKSFSKCYYIIMCNASYNAINKAGEEKNWNDDDNNNKIFIKCRSPRVYCRRYSKNVLHKILKAFNLFYEQTFKFVPTHTNRITLFLYIGINGDI